MSETDPVILAHQALHHAVVAALNAAKRQDDQPGVVTVFLPIWEGLTSCERRLIRAIRGEVR